MRKNSFATVMTTFYVLPFPILLIALFDNVRAWEEAFGGAYFLVFVTSALGFWSNLSSRKEQRGWTYFNLNPELTFDHSFSPGPGRIAFFILTLGFFWWLAKGVTWFSIAAYLLSFPLSVLAIVWNPNAGENNESLSE